MTYLDKVSTNFDHVTHLRNTLRIAIQTCVWIV